MIYMYIHTIYVQLICTEWNIPKKIAVKNITMDSIHCGPK